MSLITRHSMARKDLRLMVEEPRAVGSRWRWCRRWRSCWMGIAGGQRWLDGAGVRVPAA